MKLFMAQPSKIGKDEGPSHAIQYMMSFTFPDQDTWPVLPQLASITSLAADVIA